jgi:predicted aldo/keto reductase-like oxidoreductase
MQYRKDIKSGNNLSVLGFGCMRFPKTLGAFDLKKSEEIVMSAIDKGVNYFDTARIYVGNEEIIGNILANNNVREKVFLASKIPPMNIRSIDDVEKQFNISLEKLKTNYLDYCLMHMLSEMGSWNKLKSFGIEEWIAQKKKTGQIRQIAFSFHGARGEFISLLNDYDWDAVLLQYNYSNENYQAGVEGVKAANQKGLPVFVMEPLLGGRLVSNLPKTVRSEFKKSHSDWSPAAWGLNWLWNQSEITMVLSGMNDISQVEDNTAMADKSKIGMLTEEDMKVFSDVKKIFNESYKIKCTGCNYCMPCPKNVNIPGCFSSYNISYSEGLYVGLRKHLQSATLLSKNMSNASLCVGCGKCETHCPQSLQIKDSLKLVSKRIEPFWFMMIIKAIRKFSGIK